MSRHGAVSRAPSGARADRARRPVDRAPWPSDEEVLQTVRTLAARYRAPCTTLIVGEVAGSPRTRGLHTAVHDALQRLRADGRLARVTHRGTDRWTVTGADASVAPSASGPASLPAA